jgi:hypothetical protein
MYSSNILKKSHSKSIMLFKLQTSYPLVHDINDILILNIKSSIISFMHFKEIYKRQVLQNE